MKEENKIQLKIMSGLAALVMSASTITLGTTSAYAEGINTNQVATEQEYKNGSFIDELMEYEESQYRRYVVEKGDNVSVISKKICRYYGEDATTKYWPVLAFLNQFPRIIKPGDVLIFPSTFEDMDSLWNDLKEAGWIKKYVRENKVYSSQKEKKIVTVKDLLSDIYGSQNVDSTFVSNYLRVLGLSGKYNGDSKIEGNYDATFELTDWIPTYEEVTNSNKKRNK